MTEPISLQPDETFVLNVGPQHPATHGVLRVKMTMDGEYIYNAETVLGYIHRMHEKMAENRTYPQFMPNMGRLDYLSAMAFNHGYALVVERACGIEVPERAEYIRVITVELNRISSHLVWLGAYVLDLGGCLLRRRPYARDPCRAAVRIRGLQRETFGPCRLRGAPRCRSRRTG